ncbi:LPD7 domain-containing protein [Paraburkholderia sp. RL17-373-BIF-A]|uniref:LPD7 domain-containing protein n=1 Tax=Paraburkholderia sp. RL17-373-BIF-A TaxID=3031629 RepID=UPI0038B7600B
MDERVILAGDLDITNDIIQSMDTDAERYKTITLSFKEDDIEPATLDAIVRDFEAFAFAAYEPDEYCFYAEAHLPKIKSYTDRKSGEPVERKPHIHFVIPKVNLLSGRKLDPFAMVEHQAKFIDAFQEHINHKYGLASPKDNRRVEFTSASEMISRYKGDVFEGGNRELKAAILEAVLSRDITEYDDFRTLLQEFGETRTRNAGRATEYENVKRADAAKGVNLKEYVFSRAFVELPADEKRAVIERTIEPEYEVTGAERATPEALQDTLREWHEMRAREVKYFNGGNLNAYPFYRDAASDERRQLLAVREQRFYQRFRGEVNHERDTGSATERQLSGDVGRGYRFKRPDEPDIERGVDRERGSGDAGYGRGRRGAGRECRTPNDRRADTGRLRPDHQSHLEPDRSRTAPESFDRMRSLSGIVVDGDAARGQVLLPADAPRDLEDIGAGGNDALRWHGAGERGIGQHGYAPAAENWSGRAAQMYDAWQHADPDERQQLTAASAARFAREQYGFKGRGANTVFTGRFADADQPASLTAVKSLASVEQLHFSGTPARNRSARPDPATGREADTVRDQLARDIVEGRAIRRDAPRQEFQEIKRTLDAGRLLATLAHSHGLIPAKYAIIKGCDGGDRIQCGNRNLNVSDFLTKELNLPWTEAAQLMRDTYRAQTGRDAMYAPRHAAASPLWREFQTYRAELTERDRAAWVEQGRHEQAQRSSIRSTFHAARSAIQADLQLSRPDRKAALSVARMTRVEQETALRSAMAAEREALKAVTRQPLDERYRAFLAGQAQAGNEQALLELRRMRRTEPEPDPTYAAIRSTRQHEPNAIIYRGPVITHEVQRNGDVTYRRDGAALLVDEGPSVRLWESDRDAIETALRLAQQKFGQTLILSGPLEFQLDAARVAAETRLNVEFNDPALNRVMHDRRHELDTQAEAQRRQESERNAAMRKLARDMLRSPEPDRSGNDERSAGDDSPDVGRDQDPDMER